MAPIGIFLAFVGGCVTNPENGEAGLVLLIIVLSIGLIVLGVYLYNRNGHVP